MLLITKYPVNFLPKHKIHSLLPKGHSPGASSTPDIQLDAQLSLQRVQMGLFMAETYDPHTNAETWHEAGQTLVQRPPVVCGWGFLLD